VVITFGDYAGRWLANRKVKGLLLAMRTREGYQDVLRRFILPTFGARLDSHDQPRRRARSDGPLRRAGSRPRPGSGG
jgi:hypothetical protein